MIGKIEHNVGLSLTKETSCFRCSNGHVLFPTAEQKQTPLTWNTYLHFLLFRNMMPEYDFATYPAVIGVIVVIF